MIKASEARKLTNKAELDQVEKDINYIFQMIKIYASNGDSIYKFDIDNLSKHGWKLIKYVFEDAGYTVNYKITFEYRAFYRQLEIKW